MLNYPQCDNISCVSIFFQKCFDILIISLFVNAYNVFIDMRQYAIRYVKEQAPFLQFKKDFNMNKLYSYW